MRALAASLCLLACACGSTTHTAPAESAGSEPAAEAEVVPIAAPAAPPAAPPASAGRAVDTGTLQTLLQCWFEDPYPYMFDRSRTVRVGSGEFGMFAAGISGMLYYSDLNTCVGRITGTPPRSYSDAAPFAALAGMPIHSDQMSDSRPFGFFNPAIVEWGREHLIPDPQMQIAGLTAQQIYDRVFARFFRLMTEAYLHLANRGSHDQEMDAYMQMASDPSQDGIDWLQGRYAGQLSIYATGGADSPMTPPMAIGFWLRRGVDGTSDELWRALREVMRRFDEQWYGALRATYTSQDIDW